MANTNTGAGTPTVDPGAAAVNPGPAAGIHLMAKPTGPICNLDCSYCFYLEKEALFPERQRFLMSEEVLRTYVEQNIRTEPGPEVLFTWQGGEPMLRGLDFYRQAVRYQRELAGGKTIRNALQTNGVLLDDEWCAFLSDAGFMVGISLDGPKEIHDAARVDKRGRPTFDAVMKGIALLKKYNIELNVLVTVTDQVSKHPLEVYQFLRRNGLRHVQFNPVVERLPGTEDAAAGLTFAQPGKAASRELARADKAAGLAFAQPGKVASRESAQADKAAGLAFAQPGKAAGRTSARPGKRAGGEFEQPRTSPGSMVSEHSVAPAAYGEFLIAIFEEWVRHDVGTMFVMNFEWALASFMRLPATICLFAQDCGKALIVEHNGDVYSCDHFMYPQYRLGNLESDGLAQLANSQQQQIFGRSKSADLPEYCRRCEVRFACHGECPKNRFMTTPDGQPGLNYLCPSYKRYFTHIAKYMNAMAKLISHGQPAALIMTAIKSPLAIRLSR